VAGGDGLERDPGSGSFYVDEISGSGDIQTQGRQGTGTQTALGGTGRFANVRPTAGVQVRNARFVAFRITFTYS
jgi:hypothetical protein